MVRQIEGWSALVIGVALATVGVISDVNLWMMGIGAVIALAGIITLERKDT